MSTLIVNRVQIGKSTQPADNFTVYQPLVPNGTLIIGNGNADTSQNQIVLDTTGNVGLLGSLTASSIIKIGGSANEFLKADGSVDSAQYCRPS